MNRPDRETNPKENEAAGETVGLKCSRCGLPIPKGEVYVERKDGSSICWGCSLGQLGGLIDAGTPIGADGQEGKEMNPAKRKEIVWHLAITLVFASLAFFMYITGRVAFDPEACSQMEPAFKFLLKAGYILVWISMASLLVLWKVLRKGKEEKDGS